MRPLGTMQFVCSALRDRGYTGKESRKAWKQIIAQVPPDWGYKRIMQAVDEALLEQERQG